MSSDSSKMAAKPLITHETLAKSQVLVRRLSSTGRAIEDIIKVTAFWLWLEFRWNIESITGEISNKDDEFIRLLSDEAIAVFSSVISGDKIISSDLMRHTLTLSKRFLSLSSMFSDRELVSKELSDKYTELGRLHFQAFSGSKSKLNPCAREWNPAMERAPEEDRSLFLTFSNGFPLNESQIARFFTRKYGECVERVYVHWTDTKNGNRQIPALFGKVVFKTSYVPALILCGENEAKFWVERKPLLCKRFDREKKKY